MEHLGQDVGCVKRKSSAEAAMHASVPTSDSRWCNVLRHVDVRFSCKRSRNL